MFGGGGVEDGVELAGGEEGGGAGEQLIEEGGEQEGVAAAGEGGVVEDDVAAEGPQRDAAVDAGDEAALDLADGVDLAGVAAAEGGVQAGGGVEEGEQGAQGRGLVETAGGEAEVGEQLPLGVVAERGADRRGDRCEVVIAAEQGARRGAVQLADAEAQREVAVAAHEVDAEELVGEGVGARGLAREQPGVTAAVDGEAAAQGVTRATWLGGQVP